VITKRKQGPDAFRQHLQEQVADLRKSGAAFDGGDTSEAKRLAVAIRNLVHDTDKSHSVLTQLHAKEGLRFVDTSHGPVAFPGAISFVAVAHHLGRDRVALGLVSVQAIAQMVTGRSDEGSERVA